MTEQAITPELRRWIVEQAQAGRSAEDVLQSMLDSGWEEGVALKALESTLAAYLRDHVSESSSAPLPEPDLSSQSASIDIDGHAVQVVTSIRRPRVIVFGNVMSPAECDDLIALAQQRLARSETVDTATGASEVNAARTSDGMFFQRGENELCARVEGRIAKLLRWPVENGEGLQILRYRPGAEYKPHYDYFDPAHSGTPAILKRGGQRVATLVIYLNTPANGGQTIFPDAGIDVAPLRGHGVFFSYAQPQPQTLTLHGGAPVIQGEKWVATKWLRAGRFE